MKSRFFRNSIVAIFSGAFAASALAATFNFSQGSGFSVSNDWLISNDIATPNDDIVWYEHSSGVTPPTGTFDTIAWSLPSKDAGLGLVSFDPFVVGTGPSTHYSGMRVTGFAGQVSTGVNPLDFGDWAKISTLYHRNMAISAGAFTLRNALIYSELTLNGVFDPHAIPITFVETLNNGTCPLGNPNGTVCDDLFGFPAAGLDPVTFTHGGKNYQAVFKIDDFIDSVTNYPCPGPQCTVWTAEGKTSNLSIFMRIREIPEPASMALVGLGLLGLAGLRRRRSV